MKQGSLHSSLISVTGQLCHLAFLGDMILTYEMQSCSDTDILHFHG